jgi:hypothetical protein
MNAAAFSLLHHRHLRGLSILHLYISFIHDARILEKKQVTSEVLSIFFFSMHKLLRNVRSS